MRINKIIVENLGLYHGKQTIDLSKNGSNGDHNIILFGGLNGAGKTTLFDAVKLCLYGKDVIIKGNGAEYKEYLLSKIHHSDDVALQVHHASVAIEFQYSHFGEINTYYVQRKWGTDGSKNFTEDFLVKRDDVLLDEVPVEEWQEFIRDLIPPELSQLFFFDGEKLQRILEYNNNAEFKGSLKMLLGLDLIERLTKDLKMHKSLHLKEHSPGKIKKELNQLTKQKEELIDARFKMREQLASVSNTVQRLEDKISDYTNKMRAQGGMYLDREEELHKEQIKQKIELEAIKEKMRELAAGNFPLLVAKGLTGQLKEQVETEKDIQSDQIATEKIKSKKSLFLAAISASDFYSTLEPAQQKQLSAVLDKEFDTLSSASRQEKSELLFDLSSNQTERLLIEIESALKTTPKQLAEFTKSYQQVYQSMEDTISQLEMVPEKSEIKPMYDTISQLNQQYGEETNESHHLQEALNRFDRDIDEIERKIEKVNKQIEAAIKVNRKIELSGKVDKVLAKYKKRLVEKKLDAFIQEFLRLFHQLHRKKDIIQRMEINPNSFDITLYDSKDTEVKPESLSAGEKEIYAISLLTALAKSTGQNLPFIIDMPLGRLDTIHRDHIVEHFFPHASHQMIIFSTNTEINDKYYNTLKPHIAQSYKMEYDHQLKRTTIKEGYFWN